MTGRETTRLTPFWDWLERQAENGNLGGQRNFFSNPDNLTGIGHL
jgi:hypothetical protein